LEKTFENWEMAITFGQMPENLAPKLFFLYKQKGRNCQSLVEVTG
jgi:hypothetical protein